MIQVIPEIKHVRLCTQVPRLKLKADTYQAALELVARIDEDLTRGVRHYRTKAGRLLTCLDEVIDAIIRGELC